MSKQKQDENDPMLALKKCLQNRAVNNCDDTLNKYFSTPGIARRLLDTCDQQVKMQAHWLENPVDFHTIRVVSGYKGVTTPVQGKIITKQFFVPNKLTIRTVEERNQLRKFLANVDSLLKWLPVHAVAQPLPELLEAAAERARNTNS